MLKHIEIIRFTFHLVELVRNRLRETTTLDHKKINYLDYP